MFCNWCGSANASGARFCFKCGKLIYPAQPAGINLAYPVSFPGSQTTAHLRLPMLWKGIEPDVPGLRAKYPYYLGVGGWLLWFCIVTVISPIVSTLALLADANTSFPVVPILEMGLAVLSIIVGISVWNVSMKALTLVRILLLTNFICGAIAFVLALFGVLINRQHGIYSDPLVNGAGTTGLGCMVQSLVWFSYFRKSLRVRVTFGRNL